MPRDIYEDVIPVEIPVFIEDPSGAWIRLRVT